MALNRAVEITMVAGCRVLTPRPQTQRSRKGFVHRLLGKIKITEQADQSCQDSSRLHAIQGVEQFAYLVTCLLGGMLDMTTTLATSYPNQLANGGSLCSRSVAVDH